MKRRLGVAALVVFGLLALSDTSRLAATIRTDTGVTRVEVLVPTALRGRVVQLFAGDAVGMTAVGEALVPVGGHVQDLGRIRLNPAAATVRLLLIGSFNATTPAYIGALPRAGSTQEGGRGPHPGGHRRPIGRSLTISRYSPDFDQEEGPN